MTESPERPDLAAPEPESVDIVVELRALAAELATTWKNDAPEILAMERAARTVVYLRDANRRLIDTESAIHELRRINQNAMAAHDALALDNQRLRDELAAACAALPPEEGR